MTFNWMRPLAIAAAVLATAAGVAFATRTHGVTPAKASTHARGAVGSANGHRHGVAGPAGPTGPPAQQGPPGLQGHPDRADQRGRPGSRGVAARRELPAPTERRASPAPLDLSARSV